MAWGMIRGTVSLLCTVLAAAAPAQTNPTLAEAERGIRGQPAAKEPRLTIRALTLDAHVVGRTVDVTIEMQIASDTATPYESNLTLLLPPGAVVNGYALDVDGRMIPGQLIEAPRARNVYEDEVRGGIDPGLAEVTGNRFTTRIFPIDSAHPRRFRLGFAAAFDPASGIVLPLDRDQPIGTVRANVTVDGHAAPPRVRLAGETLDMRRTATGWSGTIAARDRTVRDGLTIDGGTLAAPMAIARDAGGERFFTLTDRLAPAAAPKTGGRLRVYWDRSVSHRDVPRAVETDALLRLVDAMAPDAIDLVTFASDAPVVTAVPRNGLRAALDRVIYRGGSSLKGLDALALPRAQRCVLVFDGRVTIDRAAGFAPDCRTMALTAAPGADTARLGRIARQSGGTLVRAAEGRAAEAAAALLAGGDDIVAVADADGRAIPWRALPAPAGHWSIVGPAPRSEVRVRFADGSERRYASAGDAVASDAAATLWAEEQVAAFADDPARHAAMAAFARRYRVAGPGMSFLVLERPDQYLRAALTPPTDFPAEWQARYRAAQADADRTRVADKRDRFAFVLDQWRRRREWWDRRFTPGPRRKAGGDAARDEAMPSAVAAPPAPPAPLAPPPPAVVHAPAPDAVVLARQPGAAAANDVVVTGARIDPSPRPAPAPRTAAVRVDLPDLLAKRPYLAALDAAAPAARLAVLAEQERAYATVPGFYLDVAEWFRLKGMAAVADLLLLSALDLPASDDETRQIVAFRLERDGQHDRAVELAEHLAAADAEFRPQPGRDLALALAARGRAAGAAGRADLERAFRLLTDVALDPAARDFDGIEVIALTEANALIPAIAALGGRWTLDPRLTGRIDLDARIVIGWTADDADIDLWVDEPAGERVYYSAPLSSAGGAISNDMTDGYGPEEYAIRRAPPGPYRVRVNGFDADRLNPNGPGHVLVRLYRNYARPAEAQDMVDVDLSFQSGGNRDRTAETVPVATLTVGR